VKRRASDAIGIYWRYVLAYGVPESLSKPLAQHVEQVDERLFLYWDDEGNVAWSVRFLDDGTAELVVGELGDPVGRITATVRPLAEIGNGIPGQGHDFDGFYN